MYTTHQIPKNKNRAAANHSSQTTGIRRAAVQFHNNSPRITALKKLQQTIDNSPQIKQLRVYQAMADDHGNTAHSFPDTVVQRSPASWQTNGVLAGILQHPHGWFSTWKQIKAQINDYMTLQHHQLGNRKSTLDKIKLLITEWENAPEHAENSAEQRVRDIRQDLPALKGIVNAEYTEVEDDYIGYYGKATFPEEIPDELTAGLDGLPVAARAHRLFQNINQFRFRYTGAGVPAHVAFYANQGDCGTLTGMYETVAAAKGIPCQVISTGYSVLVDARAINGRNETSNTEDGTHWYFVNHHWVTGNGVAYDLLFKASPPPAHIAYASSGNHNGVIYTIFADGKVVIEPHQANLGYQIQGQGKVFNTEQAAQAFIDAHPAG